MDEALAQTRWFAAARSFFLVKRIKGLVSWPKLDLQNLQFLGFSDFVHLVDEAVGELL